MKGHVLEGKILVSAKPTEKKIGNIIMPGNVGTDQREGTVEIGCEQVDAGCDIIFKANGIKLSIEDKNYILLNERDVLFVK